MNSNGRSFRALILTALSPTSSGLGAILSIAALAMAARQGQLQELAGYAAGVSLAAISGVAAGGGTTLSYLTGSLSAKSAVRRVRYWLVLPAMAIVTSLGTLGYSVLTELPTTAVVLGGVTAIANNLGEIEVGHLRAHLRTPSLAAIDILARMVTVIIVSLNTSIAAAMATGALLRILSLTYASRSDPSRKYSGMTLRQSLPLAYDSRLVGTSLLYALLDRTSFLIAPLTMTPAMGGGFSTALSLQQSATGILLSGPQTTMSVRGSSSHIPRWQKWLEGTLMLFATSAAITMIVLHEPVLTMLGLGAVDEISVVWTFIWASMPLALLNRTIQFRLLSAQRRGTVIRSLTLATATLTTTLASGYALHSPILIAASPLIAEAVAGITLQAIASKKSKES